MWETILQKPKLEKEEKVLQALGKDSPDAYGRHHSGADIHATACSKPIQQQVGMPWRKLGAWEIPRWIREELYHEGLQLTEMMHTGVEKKSEEKEVADRNCYGLTVALSNPFVMNKGKGESVLI